MSEEKRKSGTDSEDVKSSVICLGFCGGGAGSNTSIADVRDGRIVRVRPLHYDWKYDKESMDPWKWEVKGKIFEPTMKSLLPPFSLAYKKRAYSSNRILYPIKRVDWDPNGERNPQNRGKSKYKRISWKEAIDIIESEIRRIHKKYGPEAILAQGDGHGETKIVQSTHGLNAEFLNLIGGYTRQTRNSDSWEGWGWGAKHVWGMDMQCGEMMPTRMVNKDICEHSDMILFWGCDPETTPLPIGGLQASRLCYFWTEVGIKSIYICPDLNYGAAVHADKWIPVRPGTDAALQLAIAYTWITEGTYEKKYIKTHTVGFDKFADYVLGKDDGVPKTPEWASPKCTVPEWTIKAFARKWARETVSIAHGNGGPGIRSAYSTENARLEVILLAMRGLGKPGVHQIKMIEWGLPILKEVNYPNVPGVIYPSIMASTAKMIMTREQAGGFDMAAREMKKGGPGASPDSPFRMPIKQYIPKNLIHDALLNAPITWYGETSAMAMTDDQFVKYTYPAEGCSEIHMIWTDTPCWITCWNSSNDYIRGLRSEKIEFILAMHPWMENDCRFADIVLPVQTKFEEEDIDLDCMNGEYYIFLHQAKNIEAVGESKPMVEVVNMIAERFGVKKELGGDLTVDEQVKYHFNNSGVQNLVSFEEFKEKGYFVIPSDPDYDKYPVGLRNFYDNPDENPLATPSGLIEIYSERLAEHFPDDEERPPIPKWIEKGESHDERVTGERAKKYPLLQVSNHGHWRMHAQGDDISWLRECPTCKIKGPDDYLYEPLWINTQDAAARGIKSGDIVKIYNERGAVLGGAYVTERVMPGVVSMDHGARYDPIIPGELDRGGAINTITPHNKTSKNATGMVVSSFLVEVEKVTMAQMGRWRDEYSEATEKPYDPASGLCFKGVLA